jgi:2-polyprenyl-3-methyl-5-hydroxy-6-metoxy-1,4-benzoquinol methylase
MTNPYETVPCNMCGSTTYRTIYPALERSAADLEVQFKSSSDEALRDPLVACTSCGLQFVNPRLRQEVILAGYREGTDETFVSQAPARERTFAKALDMIERWAPQRGRLLDIGTAGGSFLHVAQKRGWQVDGCEPNTWLCQWGKQHYGIDIKPGTLFDQQYPENAFDVVTVWDVLEHTHDPNGFLSECQRVLKPGGILVVNVPDIGSWLARVMGRRWLMLLTTHLYYFTRQTLGALLERVGFGVVVMKPHIQWLELGYVIKRGEPVAGPLARAAGAITRGIGLAGLHVPYWIGQTLVIARKQA